jgi:hypothetical protein
LTQVKELQSTICSFITEAWSEGPSFVMEKFMDKLVLGVATLALSAGAASAQAVYPNTATAPLYDYAGPSWPPVHKAPHEFGPLIYTPQLYAPSPAFPTPPEQPGYYTGKSVVASQPSYDYAPGYWGQ